MQLFESKVSFEVGGATARLLHLQITDFPVFLRIAVFTVRGVIYGSLRLPPRQQTAVGEHPCSVSVSGVLDHATNCNIPKSTPFKDRAHLKRRLWAELNSPFSLHSTKMRSATSSASLESTDVSFRQKNPRRLVPSSGRIRESFSVRGGSTYVFRYLLMIRWFLAHLVSNDITGIDSSLRPPWKRQTKLNSEER